MILDLLSGETKDFDVCGYWNEKDKANGYRSMVEEGQGRSIQTIKLYLDTICTEEKIKKIQEPTIRYHVNKLVSIHLLNMSGSCGWGKSYLYSFVTEEERIKRADRKVAQKNRADKSKVLHEMLEALDIKYECGIDSYDNIEVNADDLIRVISLSALCG